MPQDIITDKTDAIILGGDRRGSKPILGLNKVYLEIDGTPLIVHTLTALLCSEQIGTIYMVGDTEKLQALLVKSGLQEELQKGKIFLVEQENTLIENIWKCYLESIGADTSTLLKIAEEDERKVEAIQKNEGKALFIATGDSPLITTEEVDYFLTHANMDLFDYVIGLTDIENLKPFLPNAEKNIAGIIMAPLHFREKLYRLNNLHYVRPARVHNRELINSLYHFRYLKEWHNMFALFVEIVRKHLSFHDIFAFLILESALLARKYHFYRTAEFFRRYAPISHAEEIISHLLHTRFSYLETLSGSATIDVDNEKDYRTIQMRWKEWVALLKKQEIRSYFARRCKNLNAENESSKA